MLSGLDSVDDVAINFATDEGSVEYDPENFRAEVLPEDKSDTVEGGLERDRVAVNRHVGLATHELDRGASRR